MIKILTNPHFLLVVYSLLVSFSFHVGHAITNDIDPVVLTFVRFLLGSLLFGIFVGFKYGLKRLSIKEIFGYSLISLSLLGYFFAMFYSLRYTTPMNVGVIYTFTPLFTTFYGFFMLKEYPGIRKLSVLLIVMLGAVWVIVEGSPDRLLSLSFNKGDWIFFAGCLSMGLFPVFSKIFSNNEPAPVMTFWTMAIGSVFLAAAANVKTFEMDWASAPLRLYLGIGYVTVFTTVITFLIIQYASKRLPVSKVMAYIYVIPVFVLVENIFLGFPFPDLSVIVGVVVVALGTFYFMKADKEA